MPVISATAVVGVFDQPRMSQMAVEELRRAGFGEDQIGVASRDVRLVVAEERRARRGGEFHVEEGAVAGAIAGAGAGTLWALGIAAGVLPGIGPVVAGGILGSIALSAATGALAGGVAGTLIALGLPEEEAEHFEGELRAGRTIVVLRSPDRYDEAADILRHCGAINLGSPSERNDLAVDDKRREQEQMSCRNATRGGQG